MGTLLQAVLCLSALTCISAAYSRAKRDADESCGIRKPGDSSQQAGATTHGEYSWTIGVRTLLRPGDSRERCSGSLLTPKVVLTAAHCLRDTDETCLVVRGGEWDRSRTPEEEGFQEKEVAKVLIHEEYNQPLLANDVGLIFLKEPFELTPTVSTICLPSAEGSELDTQHCLATGWGHNYIANSSIKETRKIMKKVDLPLVERTDCKNKLKKYMRKRKNFTFHASFVCAGGLPDQDTCMGDGGGPLVCPLVSDPNKYAQYGIVSWGVGCGKPLPAVYTSVQYYLTWILDKLSLA